MLGWAVCGQVSDNDGDSQYHKAIQKHQKEISLACVTAMTNILDELEGLTNQYLPLNDMGAARIEKYGAVDSGNIGLDYKKNTHYEMYHYTPGTPVTQMRPNGGSDIIDKGGAKLTIYIINLENRGGVMPEGGDIAVDYPLLLQGGRSKFLLIYNLSLNSNDPALEKAVKDAIEKQADVLRANLKNIIGNYTGQTNTEVKVSQTFSTALTNILIGLQGLAQKYSLLSDLGSATIENKGTNNLYQHLRYWKDAQAETATNTGQPFDARPVVSKGGMTLDIYILKADEPFGFVVGNGYDHTFVSADGKERISLIRRMHFSREVTTNDLAQVRATVKAIDGIIVDQVQVLRKKLDDIDF